MKILLAILLFGSLAVDAQDSKKALKAAEDAAKRGDVIVAASEIVTVADDRHTDTIRKIQQLARKYPKIKESLHSKLLETVGAAKSQAEVDSASNLLYFAERLKDYQAYDEQGITALKAELRRVFGELVIAGEIRADYSSRGLEILMAPGGSIEPRVERVIFTNTLTSIRTSAADPIRERILRYLQAHPEARDEASSTIQALTFSKAELETQVSGIYPEWAKAQLQAITRPVRVSSPSVLLREDIKTLLAKNELISIQDDAPIEVSVKEVEFEFMDGGQQNSRVIYDRWQVNLIGNLLLMPNYSTYQFDYAAGSAEVAYAYEFSISGGKFGEGKPELFRGRDTVRWSACGTPVIVNAFGGVQVAGFVANKQMQEMCNSPTRKVTKLEARDHVLSRLGEKIVSILK